MESFKQVVILFLIGSVFFETSSGVCELDKTEYWIECYSWEDVLNLSDAKPWSRVLVKNQLSPTVCEGGPFQNLPNVTVLMLRELSFTTITESCFDGPIRGSIDEINLTNNRITQFDMKSVNNSEIARLNLDSNLIAELNCDNILLPKLRHLKVYNNSLTYLNMTDNEGSTNFPALMEVFAEYNKIKRVDIKVKNLDLLRLSRNNIESLDNLVIESENLFQLNIEYNQLRSLNLRALLKTPALKYLSVRYNNITLIDTSDCNLTSVAMEDDAKLILNSPHWSSEYLQIEVELAKLEVLNLSRNAIEDFQGFPNTSGSIGIEVLVLDHNQIKDIHERSFNGLKKLFVLDLSYNQISKISKTSFEGLDNLNILKLRGNCIREFHAEIITNFKSIISLDLSHNLLPVFPTPELVDNVYKPFMSIQELILADNPMQCRCWDLLNSWLSSLQHGAELQYLVKRNSTYQMCLRFGGLSSESKLIYWNRDCDSTVNFSVVRDFIDSHNLKYFYDKCFA